MRQENETIHAERTIPARPGARARSGVLGDARQVRMPRRGVAAGAHAPPVLLLLLVAIFEGGRGRAAF